MKNILILEPSGAVSINPNLTEIIRFLCQNGFHVDVLSTKRDYAQHEVCENSSLLLCVPGAYEANLAQYRKLKARYDLVIGVDQAVVPAAFVARKMGVPFGFISYEILFADEVGDAFKAPEIEACRSASFAVSQDTVRGYLVSREYGIPPRKILCIPVADSTRGLETKGNELRVRLRIPEGKRIAIFTGAVAERSMIDDLLSMIAHWPDDWVLVVHSQHGIPPSVVRKFKQRHDVSRVFFSDMRISSIDELLGVIASADLGVCFFEPTLGNQYEGKNMLFIGLSSGKFPLYLKAGLPVMINEVGQLSDLVRSHRLGRVVSRTADITPTFLDGMNLAETRKRAQELYAARFDFQLYATDLLTAIVDSMHGVDPAERGRGLDITTMEAEIGYVNRLSKWFNEAARAKGSRYYKAGQSMFHVGALASWAYGAVKPFVKRVVGRDNVHFISRFNADVIRYYAS